MKATRFLLLLTLLILAVAACQPGGQASPPAADEAVLTVQGPEAEQTYTLEQLQALPATDVQSDDGSFTGVRLVDLLGDAGFDPDQIASVRVVALDGFSSTYQADLFTREDAVLAYARAGGDLNADELPLRMVIPGQEGRMQPRQVARIEVTVEP